MPPQSLSTQKLLNAYILNRYVSKYNWWIQSAVSLHLAHHSPIFPYSWSFGPKCMYQRHTVLGHTSLAKEKQFFLTYISLMMSSYFSAILFQYKKLPCTWYPHHPLLNRLYSIWSQDLLPGPGILPGHLLVGRSSSRSVKHSISSNEELQIHALQ